MVLSWDALNWPMTFFVGFWSGLLLALLTGLLLSKQIRFSKSIGVFLVLIPLFACIIIFGQVIGPWEVVGEGVYDHVEYTDTYSRSSHGAVRTRHDTLIFFADGTTRRIYGLEDMPFRKGTTIRILTKNGLYKIQKLERRE